MVPHWLALRTYRQNIPADPTPHRVADPRNTTDPGAVPPTAQTLRPGWNGKAG
jgi:hypothetical protein